MGVGQGGKGVSLNKGVVVHVKCPLCLRRVLEGYYKNNLDYYLRCSCAFEEGQCKTFAVGMYHASS